MDLNSQINYTQIRTYKQLLSFFKELDRRNSLYKLIPSRKNIWENKNVLELGCGAGFVVDEIYKEHNPNKIIGVDKCITENFNNFRRSIYTKMELGDEEIELRLSEYENKKFINFNLENINELNGKLIGELGENNQFDIIYSFRVYYYLISYSNFNLKTSYVEIIQNHIKALVNLLNKNGMAIIDLGYLNPKCNHPSVKNNSIIWWNQKLEELRIYICRSTKEYEVELKITKCEVGLDNGKKIYEEIPILKIIKK